VNLRVLEYEFMCELLHQNAKQITRRAYHEIIKNEAAKTNIT